MTGFAGKEIRDRWGINFLANEYDVLLESAFKETGAPQHTIDHVDCPACQFIDKRMNSDLLGMANQTFLEAAKVWQGVRRNSNILRERLQSSFPQECSIGRQRTGWEIPPGARGDHLFG